MREGLLPIGSFARAASLSIGTLRHYHDTGLLVPVHVDPASGYRYYSAAQLVDAEVIRRLRELDVPIPQVRQVLDARDERVTRRVVHEQQERMQQRLREAEAIVAQLHRIATAPLALLADRVTRRTLPDQAVLARSDTLPLEGLGDFMSRSYAALTKLAERCGLALCGPAGALYPGEDWEVTQVRVTAYLPVVGAATPPERTVLPGGPFAVATHDGPYESIGETYRGIGAWLAQHGCAAGSDIREVYLVGPGDAPDPAGYRTEIAWPLPDPPPQSGPTGSTWPAS